jgi:hypothetical protein
VLETRWHQRVKEAKLRFHSAREYTKEVEREFPTFDAAADASFYRRRAPQAEGVALGAYYRALRIYKELTVNGKVPDEGDGLEG